MFDTIMMSIGQIIAAVKAAVIAAKDWIIGKVVPSKPEPVEAPAPEGIIRGAAQSTVEIDPVVVVPSGATEMPKTTGAPRMSFGQQAKIWLAKGLDFLGTPYKAFNWAVVKLAQQLGFGQIGVSLFSVIGAYGLAFIDPLGGFTLILSYLAFSGGQIVVANLVCDEIEKELATA